MIRSEIMERVAVALALGLSLAIGATAAEPSLEQTKAESGLIFQETSGLGQASGASFVAAGKSGAARPALTFSGPAKSKAGVDVPPPSDPTPPPSGNGASLGRRLLQGAGKYLGGAAGLAATAGAIFLGGWTVAVPLALIGAGAAYYAAFQGAKSGQRGLDLVRSTAIGAGVGLGVLVTAVAAAGRGIGGLIGKGMERLFKTS